MRASHTLLVALVVAACTAPTLDHGPAVPRIDIDVDGGPAVRAGAAVKPAEEGLYAAAGEVIAVASKDASTARTDVLIGPPTTPVRCATAVTLPLVQPGPLTVGVDGTPVDAFTISHDVGAAPIRLAPGDRVCALVHRRREPPFFIRQESILVEETGRVLLAFSDSGTLQIPGWTFARGPGKTRRAVDGGHATWWDVEVTHGEHHVTVGPGPWPVLTADDGRYQVMAIDYEKEGTLVPEEAPRILSHGLALLGPDQPPR